MVKRPVEDLDLETITRALEQPRGPAFGQLYQRYNPTVRWAVGVRVLRWPELVSAFDDIVQEVWLQLLRRRHKPRLGYDARRGIPFASFLALVAGRTGWRIAKRRLRHAVHTLEEDPDDDAWDFTVEIIHRDVLQRLATHVDALDERSRRFFYGHFVEGRMIKDIGAELGLSDNASHVFKLRLAKRLTKLAKAMIE